MLPESERASGLKQSRVSKEADITRMTCREDEMMIRANLPSLRLSDYGRSGTSPKDSREPPIKELFSPHDMRPILWIMCKALPELSEIHGDAAMAMIRQ